jgi:cysteine desulfurase
VYLDNNATTRPLPEVVDAVTRSMVENWHNPSSVHRPGQAARHAVELARASVARLLNARPADLVFTSGATESISMAIRGVLAASPSKKTVVTSSIEHEAVRDLLKDLAKRQGVVVKTLPVGLSGAVRAADLVPMLDDSVALVSVMWANNETGAIQPIDDLAAICRDRGVIFHTDATQAVGKVRVDLGGNTPPCDLLSFSGHKMHAPKGVGGLWVRPNSTGRGVRVAIVPQTPGTQEKERRGGTENTHAIVGLGVASDLARSWLENAENPRNPARIGALRDRFEAEILARVPGAVINGKGASPRLWNTTNIAFPKLEAEALLLLLSERGVCASAGAACSSGSLDPSPILLAMGIPDAQAHGSLRFSLSRETKEAEIDEAISIIPACVERLRASASSVR